MHGWAADRPTVEIAHLRKTYGPLLGPNGAGRTTTVECAIRLRSPDSGTIRLLGLDPRAEQDQVHEIR